MAAATLCGREREAADALTSLQDFGGRTPSITRAIEAYDGEVMSDPAFSPPPNGNNHRRGLENIGPGAASYLGLDPINHIDGYAPVEPGVVVNIHNYARPSHLQHHPTPPFHMQHHLPQPTAPLHVQHHMQQPTAPFHMQQPAQQHQPVAPFYVQQSAQWHQPMAPLYVQQPALRPMRFCSNCREKGKDCGGLCACPKGSHGRDGCTRHGQANHSTKASSRLCKDCRLRPDLPCIPCGSYVKRQGPGGEVVLKRRGKQRSAHGPVVKRRKIDVDPVITDDIIADGSLPDFGDASGVPANAFASDQDDSTMNAVADHDTSLHGDVAVEGSTSGPYLWFQRVTPEDPLPDEDLFRGLKDRVGQILQLQTPGSEEGHPWNHQLCYWPYMTNRIMDNVFIYQRYQGKLDNDSIREALRLLEMAIRRLNAIDLTYGYDLTVNPMDLRAYLIRCAGILEADARKQGLIQ